jgi:hypothetical protein
VPLDPSNRAPQCLLPGSWDARAGDAGYIRPSSVSRTQQRQRVIVDNFQSNHDAPCLPSLTSGSEWRGTKGPATNAQRVRACVDFYLKVRERYVQ